MSAQREMFADTPHGETRPTAHPAEWLRRKPSRLAALRALLADGAWHDADELRRIAGWRYGARLHELRRGEDGGPPLTIERCQTKPGLFTYRRAP